MIMDSAKNVRWIIPFKKYGKLRDKTHFDALYIEYLRVVSSFKNGNYRVRTL